MKYLPLLALGLLAPPAFAGDTTVKAMPIPNLSTSTPWKDAVCLATGDLMVKQPCSQNAPKLVMVDDVSVAAKPLPNETAIPGTIAVNLICLVQSDASVNACKVADGDKSSGRDVAAAIAATNGKMHVTGAFAAGTTARLKIVLHVGQALPLLPIR